MSIIANQIHQEFGNPKTHVLKGINLKIQDKDILSISGKSGSGKSTLLYILSTLDHPSAGSVSYDHLEIQKLKPDELHLLRNNQIGFVFQFHYLLPELSALENVLMPARKQNLHLQKKDYALKILKQVDLENKESRLPSELSGGEQQRVAIARSLIMNPKYLFADEPTGNLDSENAKNIMEMFFKVNETLGTAIIYVTHDQDFAKLAKRQIYLTDGLITSEK